MVQNETNDIVEPVDDQQNVAEMKRRIKKFQYWLAGNHLNQFHRQLEHLSTNKDSM